MKAYFGSRGIVPLIIGLGGGWRRVIDLTLPPFTRGEKPLYPLSGMLAGPQSRSGHSGGKETNCVGKM